MNRLLPGVSPPYGMPRKTLTPPSRATPRTLPVVVSARGCRPAPAAGRGQHGRGQHGRARDDNACWRNWRRDGSIHVVWVYRRTCRKQGGSAAHSTAGSVENGGTASALCLGSIECWAAPVRRRRSLRRHHRTTTRTRSRLTSGVVLSAPPTPSRSPTARKAITYSPGFGKLTVRVALTRTCGRASFVAGSKVLSLPPRYQSVLDDLAGAGRHLDSGSPI